MSVELWRLFLAVALGLVHLAAASFAFKAQAGNRYSVGPRDEGLTPQGLAGRVLFLPLYAAGLPLVRTFSWNAATLGLVMVMIHAAA
jgi:uncharacterized MAPEG superfamily protein